MGRQAGRQAGKQVRMTPPFASCDGRRAWRRTRSRNHDSGAARARFPPVAISSGYAVVGGKGGEVGGPEEEEEEEEEKISAGILHFRGKKTTSLRVPTVNKNAPSRYPLPPARHHHHHHLLLLLPPFPPPFLPSQFVCSFVRFYFSPASSLPFSFPRNSSTGPGVSSRH